MNRMAHRTRSLNKIALRLLKTANIVLAGCVMAIGQSLPQVHLDADGLAPRPIEELTGTTIVRYYALAWRDMASALDSNGAGGLSEEFVGLAKDRLTRRASEERQTGG